MEQPFAPSWKWHIKVFAAILLLCTLAFFAISYGRRYLPQAYRPHVPPAEITPWLK